jgi:hypothetical protein
LGVVQEHFNDGWVNVNSLVIGGEEPYFSHEGVNFLDGVFVSFSKQGSVHNIVYVRTH